MIDVKEDAQVDETVEIVEAIRDPQAARRGESAHVFADEEEADP